MSDISVIEFILWLLVGHAIGFLIALPIAYLLTKRLLK